MATEARNIGKLKSVLGVLGCRGQQEGEHEGVGLEVEGRRQKCSGEGGSRGYSVCRVAGLLGWEILPGDSGLQPTVVLWLQVWGRGLASTA